MRLKNVNVELNLIGIPWDYQDEAGALQMFQAIDNCAKVVDRFAAAALLDIHFVYTAYDIPVEIDERRIVERGK